MQKTILIIDVQNGFIKKESSDIPKRIYKHIQKHPYDHVLFAQFINKKGSNFESLLNWKKLYQAPETDIVPELAPFATKGHVFKKSTYSAFTSKALLSYLKKNRITQLDLCGLESDGCVLASAFDAFDLGFEPVILRALMRSSTTLNKATEDIIKRNIDRQVKKR